MHDHGLEMPALLGELIATGRWPSTSDEAQWQNLTPLADSGRVRSVAPEEDRIFLYSPPFRTVMEEIAGHDRSERSFWTEFGEVQQIEPAHALILGDFGLGSDAPIILDFRSGHSKVLRLAWATPRNEWRVVAETFEAFVEALGLDLHELP